LVLAEAQAVDVDLDELAAGSEPAERERRLGSRRERDLQAGRRELDEEAELLVDLGALDRVVVVEREDELGVKLVELVDERREDVVDDLGARHAEQVEGGPADARLDGPERLDRVR